MRNDADSYLNKKRIERNSKDPVVVVVVCAMATSFRISKRAAREKRREGETNGPSLACFCANFAAVYGQESACSANRRRG